MSELIPVACASYALENMSLCRRWKLVCAVEGLQVVKAPDFPVGQEAGRVGCGIGIVTVADSDLGNISVYWTEDGDTTVWTRAAGHGLDVVCEIKRNIKESAPSR